MTLHQHCLSLTCALFLMACGGEKQARELEATRLELKSMSSVLDLDLETQSRGWQDQLERASQAEDMDEFVRALKSGSKDRVSACDATAARLDALEAFLIRHEEQAESLGFAGIRSRAAAVRTRVTSDRTGAETILASLRDKTTTISSREEWQSLRIDVAKGDVVIVQADDAPWTIGDSAGGCDAEGMENPDVQGYAVVAKAPVGALIVRAGKKFLFAGSDSSEIDGDGGALEARCNDREYLDNQGAIKVRVIAVKKPE